MPIKISQLPALTVVDGTVVVPVVDVSSTAISKKTTASALATYILAGNAATATKLATARTINGVSFDGTANISITTAISASTTAATATPAQQQAALTMADQPPAEPALRDIRPGERKDKYEAYVKQQNDTYKKKFNKALTFGVVLK
jgi:hypothetical protein